MHPRYILKQRYLHKMLVPFVLLALVTIISACASGAGNTGGGTTPAADRILACKSTDTLVETQDQCLLDEAACYQIKSGQWCTGPRGNVCPAGSQPLAAGSACPPGARCIRVSESLECRICVVSESSMR